VEGEESFLAQEVFYDFQRMRRDMLFQSLVDREYKVLLNSPNSSNRLFPRDSYLWELNVYSGILTPMVSENYLLQWVTDHGE